MHAEDLLINQGGYGQAVEHITEDAPESDRVAALALIIETVDSIDLGTLVIASKQEEILRILDFVAKEKANSFDGLLSTVNVVSEEEVVGLGREATVLKDPKQIVVLSVHITYNSKGQYLSLETTYIIISYFDGTWGFHASTVIRLQSISASDVSISKKKACVTYHRS